MSTCTLISNLLQWPANSTEISSRAFLLSVLGQLIKYKSFFVNLCYFLMSITGVLEHKKAAIHSKQDANPLLDIHVDCGRKLNKTSPDEA